MRLASLSSLRAAAARVCGMLADFDTSLALTPLDALTICSTLPSNSWRSADLEPPARPRRLAPVVARFPLVDARAGAGARPRAGRAPRPRTGDDADDADGGVTPSAPSWFFTRSRIASSGI